MLVGVIAAASLDASLGAQTAFVAVAVVAGMAFTSALQGLMGTLGLFGGVVAVAYAPWRWPRGWCRPRPRGSASR